MHEGGAMKKFLILCTISLGIMLLSHKLRAAVGCIDDRLHINECGAQRYIPVCCTCPCWRYEHSLDRNRCIKCLHFHDPKAFECY